MVYIEHIPKNKLSHWVEKIWYCKADNLSGVSLTIPLPNHELVFNFSDNYKIVRTDDKELVAANPISWISGLQTKAYLSHCNGKHEMIGVLFKANGLRSFLKYNSIDFFETFIDGELVFGQSIKTLIHQLPDTLLVQDKIALIENFLIESFIYQKSPAYLSHSIKQLSETHGSKGSIINLCNQLSVSNKSLIEAFKKYIGISPVRYSHILSINHALSLLSKEPSQSLTRLAYQLNFFDQPYFTNLFKSITSLTPSQYSAYVVNKQVDAGTPNFISFGG